MLVKYPQQKLRNSQKPPIPLMPLGILQNAPPMQPTTTLASSPLLVGPSDGTTNGAPQARGMYPLKTRIYIEFIKGKFDSE